MDRLGVVNEMMNDECQVAEHRLVANEDSLCSLLNRGLIVEARTEAAQDGVAVGSLLLIRVKMSANPLVLPVSEVHVHGKDEGILTFSIQL